MAPHDPRVLRAEAHRLQARAHELHAQAELAEAGHGNARDALMAYPFGFEKRAASALVRGGRLHTVKIGRRVYAKQSEILALVTTATETPVSAGAPDAAEAARAAYAGPLRVVGSRR